MRDKLSEAETALKRSKEKDYYKILGVKRDGKTDVTISPETVLDGNLTLLVLGEYTALKKCFRL